MNTNSILLFYRGQLAAFENLITEYEENGDIVEASYTVLYRLLYLSHNKLDHQTVKVMDHSKQLLRQAIKHSGVYQCQESYRFLCLLIELSSRFKNKTEMKQAMAKIAPPQMQNVDLEPSIPARAANNSAVLKQSTSIASPVSEEPAKSSSVIVSATATEAAANAVTPPLSQGDSN